MIKKILLILACSAFISSIPAYSQNIESYNNENNYKNVDCTDYPVVSAMERNVLGSTFQNENIYQRLIRLESTTLGATFPQEALCDRIDRLGKIASNNDSYAYNRPNIQQYSYQSPMQSMANSYGNNSSYGNQYYGVPQNSSKLMQILQYAIPIISAYTGSNFGNNNYGYDPNFEQEINRNQNLNYGASVRILP